MPVLGSPAFLTPLHSLTGPEGQPFASHLGGISLCPWGAPTLLELGSLVSAVSLQPGVVTTRRSAKTSQARNFVQTYIISHHVINLHPW
jgi:hypothetical protein